MKAMAEWFVLLFKNILGNSCMGKTKIAVEFLCFENPTVYIW